MEKTTGMGKTFHKDPSPACERWIKRRKNEHRMQQQSREKLPPAKEKYHSLMQQHPCPEDDCFLLMPEESKDHSFPKVQCFEVQVHDKRPYCEEPEIIKIESDSEPEIISNVTLQLILSESETEDLPASEEQKDSFFMHKGKQEPCSEKRNDLQSISSCVKVEKNLAKKGYKSGHPETSQEEDKGLVLAPAEESKVAALHRQKQIQTLTSHIKEVLLYFLPESSISREQLVSLGPEDILLMFKLKGNVKEKKDDVLYIDQYEQQLSQKVQSIEQSGLQAVCATEAEINLCKLQIKATEEKLEHLRGKAALQLLKIHPASANLPTSNLEDIDSLLEETLNTCRECMPECATPRNNSASLK